jgi:hypothetical protein
MKEKKDRRGKGFRISIRRLLQKSPGSPFDRLRANGMGEGFKGNGKSKGSG